MDHPVAVVGAGLSGLVAARALADMGRPVVVLEQAATVGGRLATRRIGRATFDHGAQFFTVRERAFEELLDAWRALGVPIREWCRGFRRAPAIADGPGAATLDEDGHPRYVVAGGLRTLAGRLAHGLDVRTGQRVRALQPRDGGWRLTVGSGAPSEIDVATVVLTLPLPEASALLGELPPAVPAQPYTPTVALLVALDAPSQVPEPGGVQFDAGPVRWLADNALKGISAQTALTVHVADELSATLLGAPDAEVREQLWPHLGAWAGDGRVQAVAVERWRHARPVATNPERAVAARIDGAGIVFAGDVFGGPRVEGAALSGLAAAALA